MAPVGLPDASADEKRLRENVLVNKETLDRLMDSLDLYTSR